METEAVHISEAIEYKGQGEQIDFDARGVAYAQAAILESRQAYFAARCPKQYVDFNPDHEAIQANRAQIDQVLDWKFGTKGILAAGPTRRGKTRAMFALCRRLLCEEARDVAIWHAQDFFAELQMQVRFGRDEAGDFIKRQANRSVLFIDDYGQEAVKANAEDWAQGWFMRLLDMRVGLGLPVLLTTNLSARQLSGDFSGTDHALAANPMLRRMLDLAEPIKFA